MPHNHIRKPIKECSILYNPFNYSDDDEEEDPESGTDLSDNDNLGDDKEEEEELGEEDDEGGDLIVEDENNVDELLNRKKEINQEITEFYMDKEPPYSSLFIQFIGNKSFEKSSLKYNVYYYYYYIIRK